MESVEETAVALRLQGIRQKIAQAAVKAGRDPASARLLGVTKTVPPGRIRAAYDAGLRLFGENYVQEALAKIDLLPPDAQWHMIGHLQSNKARRAAELFSVVQTLDRPSLAEALQKAAAARGLTLPVLLEYNVGDEDTKAGASQEALLALARRAPEWPNLQIRGLMALPPYRDEPEEARPFLRAVRDFSLRIGELKIPGVEMAELSMGTSHDYAVAVEEGATIVRVGTALFGDRE